MIIMSTKASTESANQVVKKFPRWASE